MKIRGKRTSTGVDVRYKGKPLSPRNDLRNHSPDGFEWGYQGSGPAQLALAILARLKGPAFAQEHYQRFKREVIAKLPKTAWELTAEDVEQWSKKALQEKSESNKTPTMLFDLCDKIGREPS